MKTDFKNFPNYFLTHNFPLHFCINFEGDKMVKSLPAMQETWVRSLGWEDPLEKGIAIHFSILVWRIPWTEEPGGLHFHFTFKFTQNTKISLYNLVI